MVAVVSWEELKKMNKLGLSPKKSIPIEIDEDENADPKVIEKFRRRDKQ